MASTLCTLMLGSLGSLGSLQLVRIESCFLSTKALNDFALSIVLQSYEPAPE